MSETPATYRVSKRRPRIRRDPAQTPPSDRFDVVYLPRRADGSLDFPRWTVDHETLDQVLAEHSQDLLRVSTACVSLGLASRDAADMLDQWSWTWQVSTLVWLRALRGLPDYVGLALPR